VDVALKAVRAELSSNERAPELLRQEVRSAREVVSPNVRRIYDLAVEDGRELVSMEYIDGTTLAETLRERGPLELREAREIAAQFLSGLEAIHEGGLVHRDFKAGLRVHRYLTLDRRVGHPPSQQGDTRNGRPRLMVQSARRPRSCRVTGLFPTSTPCAPTRRRSSSTS
jgi:serine/threonine protein kinase